MRQTLEHHHIRIDKDIADGFAFHDEPHLPLLGTDNVDVVAGGVEQLAYPDQAEVAAA